MDDLIPLHLLSAGDRAEIGYVGGSPSETQRLQELGIRQGSSVEIIRQGSPCIIRVAGARICFRENEAFQVLVRSRMNG